MSFVMLFSTENGISTAPKLASIYYLNTEKEDQESIPLIMSWIMHSICPNSSSKSTVKAGQSLKSSCPRARCSSTFPNHPQLGVQPSFPHVPSELQCHLCPVPQIKGTTKYGDNLYQDKGKCQNSCNFCHCVFQLVCELPALAPLQGDFALNSDFTATPSRQTDGVNCAAPLIHQSCKSNPPLFG